MQDKILHINAQMKKPGIYSWKYESILVISSCSLDIAHYYYFIIQRRFQRIILIEHPTKCPPHGLCVAGMVARPL